MAHSDQAHADFRFLLIVMCICECVIVLGGWTIYKWEGAVIMILTGTAGVICSFAAIKRMIDDEEKTKYNHAVSFP